MRVIGKYVRAHARHFRQQSDYTICAAFDEKGAGWRFHPHDSALEFSGSRGRQDYVWKFDLPSTERIAILKSLDQYNLNAFSLFDSQETLLETMWLREQVSEAGALPMIPPSEIELPFSGRKLAELLKEHGYDTHPQGMVQPFGDDYEKSSDGQTIFVDVNAEAVRKNDETPDRPIRLTFERAGVTGGKHVWRLKSVAELAPGVSIAGAGPSCRKHRRETLPGRASFSLPRESFGIRSSCSPKAQCPYRQDHAARDWTS